jgi:hypothetical protein
MLATATPASTQPEKGPGMTEDAQPPHQGPAAARQGNDSSNVPRPQNHVVLTGALAADPRRDQSRGGDPVTLLLIAFHAPDASEAEHLRASAVCEIEVPSAVVKNSQTQLRAGESLLVAGQLTGGGGILATHLSTGPPVEDDGHLVQPDRQ